MLQQILRDMYVDPDILAELPEEQKEMLFFKIRQEQIRRYNESEKKKDHKSSHKKAISKKGKKVRILEDSEGNPWTWVYGEGEGVLTVEEKWKRIHEKRMESVIKAVIEEDEQIVREHSKRSNRSSSRQHGEMIIVKKSSRSPSSSPNGSPKNSSPISKLKTSPVLSLKRKEAKQSAVQNNTSHHEKSCAPSPPLPRDHHDAIVVKATHTQKIEAEKPKPAPKPKPRVAFNSNAQIEEKGPQRGNTKKVSGFERKDIETRKKSPSAPIPIRNNHHDNKENVESIYESFHPEAKHDEAVSNEEWQTQLTRFKEADRRRSLRARRASVEYRRQSKIAADPGKLRVRFKQHASDNKTKPAPALPPKPNSLRSKHPVSQPGKLSKPQSRADVQEWFENTQVHNISQSDSFPPWMHGLLPRAAAEELLKDKETGDFLIRVSDKIWGYALSYKDADRTKHFLIDGSEEQCYHFFGNDQIRHESLDELILYHREEPITYNGEKLKNWVGQRDPKNPDYSDLECTAIDTRL